METLISDADKNLLVKWEGKFNSCNTLRSKYEQQWYLNLAFFSGKQWVSLDISRTSSSGYTLTDAPKGEAWRERSVRNKIKRIIRNELTKLTKEEPQFYVNPSTTEDEDRMAAIAAEAISEFHLTSENFATKRSLATFWALICGTGYIKTFYNPGKKTPEGHTGKVEYEGLSAWPIYVPYLDVIDLQDQPYVFHARTIGCERVSEVYGKDLKPDTISSSNPLDSKLTQALGINKNSSKTDPNEVYVKELWIKPCRDFPAGVMFVYAADNLLYMQEGNQSSEPDAVIQRGEFPYKHLEFPFQKITHIPTGTFYGESTIKELISAQRDYNRIRSQIIEHRNMVAKPQFEMTKGAFNVKQFNSRPGLILQVNPGFKGPVPIEKPPLEPVTFQELDVNMREMDDISGQFEISRGRTPPGVEAASAIAFLQEETDTILLHTVDSIELAVQSSGRQTLDLVSQYWQTERITEVISKNNELEASLFKQVQISSNMDFHVVSGSMTPRSNAGKQAMITELIKNGIVPPEKALKYMQLAETNKLYDEMQIDTRQAQRENFYMTKGQELKRQNGESATEINQETGAPELVPSFEMRNKIDPNTGAPMLSPGQPPQIDPMTQMPVMGPNGLPVGAPTPVEEFMTINSFDDHPTHIDEHTRYMKGQQYETLPPEIKKIFLDHVRQHKEEMASEMMAMQPPAPPMQGQEVGPT